VGPKVGARVALDRVVKVRKLERVAQKEHRRVVAHHVPVAFFRVKLDRKAANIALRVRRAGGGGRRGQRHALRRRLL
jgi:hypothetical protein